MRLAVGGMGQIPPDVIYASSLQTRLAKAELRTPSLTILHRFHTQEGFDFMNIVHSREEKSFSAGENSVT